MLAVRIHEYGNCDALSLDDIPVPEIERDELLVKVDAEAASLPLAGITAWEAIVDAARVQPGQRVLALSESGRAVGKIVLYAGTP